MILHLLRMRRNVNRNVFNDRKNVSATPATSPDCLLCEITQPSDADSRLSETKQIWCLKCFTLRNKYVGVSEARRLTFLLVLTKRLIMSPNYLHAFGTRDVE